MSLIDQHPPKYLECGCWSIRDMTAGVARVGILNGWVFMILGQEKVRGRVELQSRDVEVLLYLNEMGWADSRILGLRFFVSDEEKELSEARLRVARKRLWHLKNAGFLRTFRIGRDRTYYASTQRAVDELRNRRLEIVHMKALVHVSFSKNTHNQLIHYSRINLEKAGLCFGWRSERRLKFADLDMQKKAYRGEYQPYIPDGVFLGPDKRRIVFEYEHAIKTSKQAEKKIEQLDRLMEFFPDQYQQVMMVLTSEAQKRKYENLIGPLKRYEFLSLKELEEKGGVYV